MYLVITSCGNTKASRPCAAKSLFVDASDSSTIFMIASYQDMQLDVLIYAEIAMDPVNYLMSFSRLAPVQVVTHGSA